MFFVDDYIPNWNYSVTHKRFNSFFYLISSSLLDGNHYILMFVCWSLHPISFFVHSMYIVEVQYIVIVGFCFLVENFVIQFVHFAMEESSGCGFLVNVNSFWLLNFKSYQIRFFSRYYKRQVKLVLWCASFHRNSPSTFCCFIISCCN